MSKTSINPTIILNELNSEEVKNLFEHLQRFLEHLEEKNDPEPIEIQIVDSAYQLIEKMQLFESVIKQYGIKTSEDLLGSKLDKLYNSGKGRGGTSTLFKQ
jgi:hypothetical protein